MTFRAAYVPLMVVATLTVGCVQNDAAVSEFEQAGDAAEALIVQSSVVAAFAAPINVDDPEDTSEGLAAQAASNLPAGFGNAACVMAAAASATRVDYTLERCTTVAGSVPVSGLVSVSYTVTQNRPTLGITTTDLTAGSAVVSFEATAQPTAATNDGAWSVTAEGDATGPRGSTVRFNGNATLAAQSGSSAGACSDFDGDFSVSTDTASWATEVVDVQHCGAECPAEGGTLAFTSAQNTFTLVFDGGSGLHSMDMAEAGTLNLQECISNL